MARAAKRLVICLDNSGYEVSRQGHEARRLGSAVPPGSGAALQIREIERGAQSLGKLLRIVIGPEVHEIEAGSFVDHVTVQSRHFDAVLS